MMGAAGYHLPVLVRMAVIDVGRRPWRLGFLAAGIALAGAATFGSLVFHASIGRSLDQSMARLGADAAIVPAGVTANLTPLLLTVEPGPAVINPLALAKISALPVVGQVAAQRSLKMADTSGHLPIDLIVFDPAADLTVQPWVEERLERPFRPGDVIVGGRRPEAVGERLMLQGVEATVHARLGLAGAGPFERSMFIGPETARLLAGAKAVMADGKPFPADPLDFPSGAMIRLAPGRGLEELRFAAASVPEVAIVAGGGSQVEVRQAVAALSGSSLATLLVALVAPAVLVGVAYAGMLAERRRELGTMLALGVPRRDIVVTVAVEAALAALAGAFAGIVMAFMIITGFTRTVGFFLRQRAITLAMPSYAECGWFAFLSALAVAATVVLAAMCAAWIAARRQPWTLLRGDAP